MKTVNATTDRVVCTLTDSEQRARREELRTGVLALTTAARETEDGYAFGFAPGSVDRVREFVAFESRCCSFLTFTIDDRDDRVTWLHVSGPEGTKQFLRSWLPAGASTSSA